MLSLVSFNSVCVLLLGPSGLSVPHKNVIYNGDDLQLDDSDQVSEHDDQLSDLNAIKKFDSGKSFCYYVCYVI